MAGAVGGRKRVRPAKKLFGGGCGPWRSCRRAKEARASAKREHVPSPRVVGRKRAALRHAGSSGAARVAPFFAFGSFIFCCMVKLLLHNSSSLTAASLGGADAAAHTVVMSVAMFCFVLGDVGSSLSQAFLSPFYTHTHTHTHRSPTRTGPCTFNAVGLLSLDVETRGSPPPAPPPRVCGEVYLTLPYADCCATHCTQPSHSTLKMIHDVPQMVRSGATVCVGRALGAGLPSLT